MRASEKGLIFLSFFLFFSFFSSFKTRVQVPDEEYVLRVAQNLAEGRALDLPDRPPYRSPSLTELGRDGKRYSTYPIGASLVMAPFYRVSKEVWSAVTRKEAGSEVDRLNAIERKVTRSLYLVPALFSAGTCLFIVLFCLFFGAPKRTALLVSVISGLGTLLWPYSKFLLSESMQTFFLLSSIYLLCRAKRERSVGFPLLMAGLTFGFLCAIRPPFLGLGPLLGLYWFYRQRRLRPSAAGALLFLGSFFLIFGCQLAYNHLRFSNTANFGYTASRFSTPWFVGVYGLFFSAGKSFFLYSPVTLLGIFSAKRFFRDHRDEAILFLGVIALMVFTYARWDIWSGDYAWGPRFLVPLVPFFMIPLVSYFREFRRRMYSWKTLALAGLLAFSFVVQLLGVSVHYLTYLNFFKQNVSLVPPSNVSVDFRGELRPIVLRDNNFDYQFVPEFSPILGHWWVIKTMIFRDQESFENTPWRALGLNRYMRPEPLQATFDFWFAEALRGR